MTTIYTIYGKLYESELRAYTNIFGNVKDAKKAIRNAETAYAREAAKLNQARKSAGLI